MEIFKQFWVFFKKVYRNSVFFLRIGIKFFISIIFFFNFKDIKSKIQRLVKIFPSHKEKFWIR